MKGINPELRHLILQAQGNRSQNQFALQCGISSAAITRITSGNYNPSAKTLKKIATCAHNGVTYEMLLTAAGLYESVPFSNSLTLSEKETELLNLINQLNDEEVKELSNFIDYIISKRK